MKTFKRLALGGALLIAAAAAADTSGLPYYSDKTLTPYWPENQASLPDHRMENFKLSNQLGESFGSSDAEGRIRIVNFFFATCPGICPLTMFNLRRVRDAIEGEEAMLLSFSITANIDTPKRLADYAQINGIEADNWQLLTGDEPQITALAEDTFFSVLERNVKANAMAHTERAYLVDQDGYIRGVYNATSAADILRLVEDMELLR